MIARTKPTPTELPSEVEEKIKSYDSRVRLIAVQDLVIGSALSAYYALEHLSKDDSRTVSKAAEEGLMSCPEGIRKIVHPLLPPDIIKLSADARELCDKEKYEEAVEKWGEVLELDPENIEANEGIEKCKIVLVPEEKIKVGEKVKKYCPRCGHPNTRRLNYCVQCGAELFRT